MKKPDSTEITPGWLQAEKEAIPERGGCTIWLDVAQTVPMFFRRIPAGSFRMGSRGMYSSEEPIHRVEIRDDFYCGTFPVTQAQYAAFREEHDPDRPYNPVVRVSWDDAKAFVVWLNGAANELPSGFEAALPSEAQWEYACRAGSETEYSSGDGEAALREVGWFDGNSGNETHPVGALKPNAWHLYDMHGNVDEWCEDVWDDNAYRKPGDHSKAATWSEGEAGSDLEKDEEGRPRRVLRGGSWFRSAWWCRSAYRLRWRPGVRGRVLGFRLVLVPVSDSPEPDSSAGGEEGAGAVSDGTERKADARDEAQVAWDEDAPLPNISTSDRS